MLSFKYKLYRTHKTSHLDRMLEEAAYTWNRALAIQKRYYSLYGKHIQCSRMKAHFAKRSQRELLSAASAQEILERQEMAFTRFFKKVAKRPPKFKKTSEFHSIIYKLCGFRIYGNELIISKTGEKFKFSLSRPYRGDIKRIQITRTPSGDYFLIVTTNAEPIKYQKTHNGASVGMDFGLKTFLTLSDGTRVEYPRFLAREIKSIARMAHQNSLSPSKKKRLLINKKYKTIRNQRIDWQWKLAHRLCREYDYIYIEDLNISGMGRMRRWGRKLYDSAFSNFVEILGYVSSKYGVSVRKIDRKYPSSKTCSFCGYVNHALALRDREWYCPECGERLDRDVNAAINIQRQGIVSSKSVRKSSLLAEHDCIRDFA